VQNVSSRAPWTVLILPFLEESARYDRFQLDRRFFGLWTDNGLFFNNSAVRIASIRDGASNVIMLGETEYAPISNWGGLFGGSWASSFRTAGHVAGSACGGPAQSCSIPIGVCGTMNPQGVDCRALTAFWPSSATTWVR